MPIETPPPLVDLIDRRIRDAHVPLKKQVAALEELFEMFTSRRGRLPRGSYLDDPRYRLAYLRYHLPLNVARSTCVLRDVLSIAPEIAEYENIVDLGAGPGSSAIATLLELSRMPDPKSRSLLLTDKSRAALRVARELIDSLTQKEVFPASEVTSRVETLPQLPTLRPRSIVWLSLVLNELLASPSGIDKIHFAKRLEESVRPPSVLIIVEPALREPGRRLLEFRDILVASSLWRVLGPCTHDKSCPLLEAKGRPWCHFHFAWRAGEVVERIARPLGLKCERSSLCYLALERVDDDARGATPDLGRVIGDPMRVHGGERGAYVCQVGKRQTFTPLPVGLNRGDLVRRQKGDAATIVGKWPG